MEAGTKFISLLKHPFSAQENEIAELHKLAGRYPFSSSVQVLLAKILKEQGSFDTSSQIKKAAVVSPNRKMLYNYLEQKITAAPVEKIIPELVTVPEVKEDKIALPVVPVVIPEVKESAAEPPVVIEPEPVKEAPVYFKPEEEKPNPQEEKTQEPEAKSAPEPVKPVFADKLEKIIQLNQSEERFVKEIPKPEEPEEERPTEELIYKAEAVKHEPLEREILKEAIDKTIQIEVDHVELPAKPMAEEEPAEAITPEEPSGFNYWLNPVVSKDKGREKKLKQIDDLIDKFIKSEPKITPKKVEFYTAANAAKQSVELYEDLVSEPLAQIFEKQGYFDKAIKTYEKLSLKFPEKRTYFAARIEKIRDIIKNIKKEK